VQPDGSADDARVAAKSLLPLAVPEDGDERRTRRSIFLRGKGAADKRPGAKHLEIVAGDDLAEHLLRLARAARNAERHELVRRQPREHVVLVAVVAVIERRGLQESEAAVLIALVGRP